MIYEPFDPKDLELCFLCKQQVGTTLLESSILPNGRSWFCGNCLNKLKKQWWEWGRPLTITIEEDKRAGEEAAEANTDGKE